MGLMELSKFLHHENEKGANVGDYQFDVTTGKGSECNFLVLS